MPPLRDHLLRTMAAVPPASRVLILADSLSDAAEPLTRLGFEVCRRPVAEIAALAGAHFDWVVAVLERADPAVLREVRRVLKPGGWVYAAIAAERPSKERPSPGERRTEEDAAKEEIGALMAAARLAEAQPARRVEASGQALVQAIYRRVEADTPA